MTYSPKSQAGNRGDWIIQLSIQNQQSKKGQSHTQLCD